MRERTNITFMCDRHAPKPDKELAKLKPEELVGKFVKAAFRAIDPNGKPRLKHRWVKVESVKEDGSLFGTLDNDPFYACFDENENRLKHRSKVSVKMADLEEVLE